MIGKTLSADQKIDNNKQKLCKRCGRQRIAGCDGEGWMEPLGPYPDGSYMTMRPCLNDNPYYETH